MKVTGVRHTGFTVRNLRKSLAFYRDVIGMTEENHGASGGKKASAATGVPGARVKMAFLTFGPVRLELMEYVAGKGKQAGELRPNDVGNVHVCFEVDDIEGAYGELQAKGVKFAGPPVLMTRGDYKGLWAIYCSDPDGISLELVQPPPQA